MARCMVQIYHNCHKRFHPRGLEDEVLASKQGPKMLPVFGTNCGQNYNALMLNIIKTYMFV